MLKLKEWKSQVTHFAKEQWKNTKAILKTCSKFISVNRGSILYYSSLMLILAVMGTVAQRYRQQDSSLDTNENQEEIRSVTFDHQQPFESAESTEKCFSWPISGQMIADYSEDTLVWSQTLGQWQTHPAIDIAASSGETVAACADGEIIDAYYDSLFGNTIIIDHGDGMILRYASLSTLELVEIGDKVKTGDTISAVGNCYAESETAPHLHLEYYVDGESTDPKMLFADEAS